MALHFCGRYETSNIYYRSRPVHSLSRPSVTSDVCLIREERDWGEELLIGPCGRREIKGFMSVFFFVFFTITALLFLDMSVVPSLVATTHFGNTLLNVD